MCRVALGYLVRTAIAHDENMKSMDPPYNRIFPRIGPDNKVVTRELAAIPNVSPKKWYHSLLAESHKLGGPYRYREFISFTGANVYPEYLIAYQRCNGHLVK